MPELPEVESARAQLQKTARGKTIRQVHLKRDPLVFKTPTGKLQAALLGRKIKGTGRKGKHYWAELDRRPWPGFHFGMSGSMHVYQKESDRPSHWKMEWVLNDGTRIAWRDPRRFGRIRLLNDPKIDLDALGFDPLLDLPAFKVFRELVLARKKNVKALLLDQSFSAGVGNWIADEILFQAKISPRRYTTELTEDDLKRLRARMKSVVETAVAVDADSEKFPKDWLFHYRWSEKRKTLPSGKIMVRETVAGRTTAWVPDDQF